MTASATRIFPAASLCRLDADVLESIATGRRRCALWLSAGIAVVLGAGAYGFVFGCWRSWQQAIMSAFKMPVLILLVTLVSIVVNAMLAQILGAGLTFRQVSRCFLTGYAIVSLLLASVSPAMLVFVMQSPGPADGAGMTAYRALLVSHTSVVGICGILGNFRCHRILARLTRSRATATRVLAAWILVTGFAGTQLSWLLSPFLCRPDAPVRFFNPLAFKSNFFEYLWQTISNTL